MPIGILRFVYNLKVFIMMVFLGKFISKCLRNYKHGDVGTEEGPEWE